MGESWRATHTTAARTTVNTMPTTSLRCALARWLLLALVLLPAAAPAADRRDSLTPERFLEQAAGVYKRHFQNGAFLGPEGQVERYESEDILEVVPVSEHAAYIRMDLEFFNGHSGRIYGIASFLAPASLVYDNGMSGEQRCVLEIEWTASAVVAHADYAKTPGCSSYHGVRGSLDHAQFARSQRRTIRYLKLLKNSEEFKAAWEEYSRRTAPAR
jgi:hypothetical protein